MSMKLPGIVALIALSGTFVLAGCSSSTTEAGSATSAAASASSATPSEASGQGCTLAEVSGKSKNKEVMALATAQYASLDCNGDLVAQVKVLGNNPALQKKVKVAGLDLTTNEAAGAATLSVVDVDQRTSCIITVMNSPKAKTLSCGDS
jgi:hypothetical protein